MTFVFPKKITRFDRLDSTMTEAQRLIEAGKASHGQIILAQEQTHGRGRQGRSWISMPGNLMASIILELDCSPFQAAELSFASALSIGETIKSFIPNGAQVCYKWPNDVLVNQSKIAGVLLEAVESPPSGKLFLIVGIGLNVFSSPKNTLIQSICLADITKDDLSLEQVELRLWKYFHTYFQVWLTEGFASIRHLWLNNAASRGQMITVSTGEKTIDGIFMDIDPHGRLVLETTMGDSITILSGDVFFPQLRMNKKTK